MCCPIGQQDTVLCSCLIFRNSKYRTNSSADSLDDTQGNESDEAKEEEGIISAMDNEIALLLKQADIDHVDHIGDMDFHVGELCGKQVVIVKSGIGKVRAAAGIAAMLDTYNLS